MISLTVEQLISFMDKITLPIQILGIIIWSICFVALFLKENVSDKMNVKVYSWMLSIIMGEFLILIAQSIKM